MSRRGPGARRLRGTALYAGVLAVLGITVAARAASEPATTPAIASVTNEPTAPAAHETGAGGTGATGSGGEGVGSGADSSSGSAADSGSDTGSTPGTDTSPGAGTGSDTETGPGAGTSTDGSTPVTPALGASSPASSSPSSPTAASTTVEGSVEQTPYGDLQVSVTFSGEKITKVTQLRSPDNEGRSVMLNQYAAPILEQEVIASQSAKINSVSGATFTSEAYIASVQYALDHR